MSARFQSRSKTASASDRGFTPAPQVLLPRGTINAATARDVLESPGQALDQTTRSFMEPRFGHDFSKVQVHTGAKAAESARAVNALAYTVGRDVVFGERQYAPHTDAGRELLAHELAHTIQQDKLNVPRDLDVSHPADPSEREAHAAAHAAMSGKPVNVTSSDGTRIARQPAPTATKEQTPTATPQQTPSASPAVSQPITRAAFDKVMMDKFGVKAIATATFENQSFGDMDESKWHRWDPGSSSLIYTWIIEAFQSFEGAFGGLPPVTKIVFAESTYATNDSGHVVAVPGVLSSYGLGQLNIFKGFTRTFDQLQITGSLKKPTPEESVHRNITHELAHGIAETALDQPPATRAGADPTLFVDYRKAVGWTPHDPAQLFDGQRPDVQQALKDGTLPPAEARITKYNWTNSTWKERPLTQYMTDNPGDDFAEAVVAYINDPQTLKSLSPIRFSFLDARKARWLVSGQPKVNIWEQVKRGGAARTLQPSRTPTIWERARDAK